jgi:hypothetical protein
VPRKPYPHTPDGRYFVVRGRLWRCADPRLPEADRTAAVHDLMRSRRAMRSALASGDPEALRQARDGVQSAKVRLGERGPPWWSDGSTDYSRHMARNTPYAAWYAELDAG